MSDEGRRFRYDAFISYRHVEPDRGWAKWLHSALETYRVPRELVRKGFPARLTRVFRDEEELPANADLSTQITTALDESKFLIVVCSPRAPSSKWVNAEVEHFRRLGRHDRILALLIEGEPRESFPPALTEIRRKVIDTSAGGAATERDQIEEVEPLAADVRTTRSDTKAHVLRGHARLRIMACILGCRFDDLRQREAERRARRARAVGIGLAALALVLAGLTTFALLQRAEAVRQRHAAVAFGSLISEDLVQAAVDAQDPAVADTLARAARRVPERFAGNPALMAEVSIPFADALMRAGDPRAALELLERVRREAGAALEGTAALSIDNAIADARLRQSITAADLDAARARLASVTAERGENDPLVLTLRNQFAGLLKNAPGTPQERAASLDESEKVYQAVAAARAQVLGADHLDTLVTRHNLAIVELHRARAAWRAIGPDGAGAGAARDRFSAAILARQSVTRDTRTSLGDSHPQTLATWSDEVALRAEAGRIDRPLLDEALVEYPVMLDALRRALGVDHWRSLEVTGRFAQALGWAGRDAEAARQWSLLLECARAALGTGHGLALAATDALAADLERDNRLDQAEGLLLRALSDAATARDRPLAAKRAALLARFFTRHGRDADARRWSAEADSLAQPHPEK